MIYSCKMFWSPYQKVEFDLLGLDLAILRRSELAELDGYLKSLEVAIRQGGSEFTLYHHKSLYGPQIDLYGPKNIASDVVDTLANGIAGVVKGEVGRSSMPGALGTQPLRVVNIRVSREELENPPFPLASVARYLEDYGGIGDITKAACEYRYVPKSLFRTVAEALGAQNSIRIKHFKSD